MLRRFPSRRYELAFASAVVVGCGILIYLARDMKDVAGVLTLVSLELVLPLSMGLVSAGLLAGDPSMELVLTVHLPAWRVLLERTILLSCVAAGFGAGLIILAEKCEIPIPRDSTDRVFIWLPPLAAFLGLAAVASLLRGRSLDGMIAVAGVTGFSLLALLKIPQLCAGLPKGAQCAWWLATPLMSLVGADHPTWPLNRLVWLGVGIGLLAVSFSLARREEPLLPQGSVE